jgi:hypothetical protein
MDKRQGGARKNALVDFSTKNNILVKYHFEHTLEW